MVTFLTGLATSVHSLDTIAYLSYSLFISYKCLFFSYSAYSLATSVHSLDTIAYLSYSLFISYKCLFFSYSAYSLATSVYSSAIALIH